MGKRKNKLDIGKFYYIFGGSPHPCYIFKYDVVHKTFISVKFGTTRTRHMTKIHSLTDDNKDQFVHNRPFEGTIKDYGKKEIKGLSINKNDLETIKNIMKQNPIQTKNAKKRYKK